MLFYFSPTCRNGDEQFIQWKEVVKQVDPKRFQLLGLVSDFEEPAKIEAYLKSQGLDGVTDLQVAYAPFNVRRDYALFTAPLTVVVSNTGSIEKIWPDRWDSETNRAVSSLLAVRLPGN